MMGVKSVYSDPFDLVNADIEQILTGMERFVGALRPGQRVAKERRAGFRWPFPSGLHFITDISEPVVLSCGLPLGMSAPYGQGHGDSE